MPKTLTEKLTTLKAAKKGIFVPYIMAGDHEKGLDGLAETIHFLEDSGVSAIEIGVPFLRPSCRWSSYRRSRLAQSSSRNLYPGSG